MNPRRFATVSTSCGTVVLAGWVIAGLAGFGSAGIENTGAISIEDRRALSLAANAELADAPRATVLSGAAIANADAATAARSVTGTATDRMAASDKPESIVVAALPDSSQKQPKTPPIQVATASTPDPVPNDAREAVSSVEILDECLVAEICIDRYLWALYQRTPKVDTIKVREQRKVSVKKKGKTVTVTKSFTKLVNEDFTWKDPKAAEKAGMPMMDYVIGGMDRSFKLKLFQMLRAAEEAGLWPGITSAFRDDYRQSIASGLKAAADRSYHGGSFRGGYGHGLAADAVSVKGTTRTERWISTEIFWKWIDAHGKEFGIGRPYLDKDPPHLAPIDGKEYAAHRGEMKVQYAGSEAKKRARLARDDHSVAKTPKNRKIVEGENNQTRFRHAFQHDAGKATKLKPISQTTAPAHAGSAGRYTNQGAISDRPTIAALKRSQIESNLKSAPAEKNASLPQGTPQRILSSSAAPQRRGPLARVPD